MRPAAVAAIVVTVILLAGIGWIAVRAGRRERALDRRLGTLVRFDDIAVTPTRIAYRSGRRILSNPLRGVHAHVESVGQLTTRITATRLVPLGVFALALRKRTDDRSVFLIVEGPGLAIVREIPVRANPGIQRAAREMAAAINAQAATATTSSRDAAPSA